MCTDIVAPAEFFNQEPEQTFACSKGWGARCARAKSKRCRCQCHGHNHGNPEARLTKNGKAKGNYREHLGPDASLSPLFAPYGAEAMKRTPKCRWCEDYLCGPVIGYPHDGGWIVPGLKSNDGNGAWWLFIVCESCNYEWALWKLGLSRDWTPRNSTQIPQTPLTSAEQTASIP